MLKSAFPFQIIDSEFSGHKDLESLEETLRAYAHRPIGPMELAVKGFVPPFGDDDSPFVQAANGYALFAVQFEERRVPADAIQHELTQRIREIETNQAREVGRREKKELKENIEQALRPKVLPKRRRVLGYFSPQGRFVVEATSEKRAAEVASLMREALGSLPVARWTVVPDGEVALSALMTRWLDGGNPLPKDIDIGDEAVLRGEEGETARLTRHDLSSDEIKTHLNAGKQVARLGLLFAEGLSFSLDEAGPLLKLRETDALAERINDNAGEDPDAINRAISEFLVKASEVDRLIDVIRIFYSETENESN